jgi:hypothetical protein
MNFRTKLSNAFATMATIGAQANGNVVGENATALSKWNDGLIDRLNPVKSNKKWKYYIELGKLNTNLTVDIF